mmetsp:Transcript_3998/g.12900  ORF Transcript_3998/g.12900 Transcript_3998/m.12900 type:complete len:120 (-) Transcript_3998:1523-1882(-)
MRAPTKRSTHGASRRHWCGPQTAAWAPPVDTAQWQAALERAGLSLTSTVDLGEEYGLRHRPWATLLPCWLLLRAAYLLSLPLPLTTPEAYLSSFVGGLAREILLRDGAIAYTALEARRP